MVRTRLATDGHRSELDGQNPGGSDSCHANAQPPRDENPSRADKTHETPSPPTEAPKDQKLVRQETKTGEAFPSSEESEQREKNTRKGKGRGRGRRATPGRGRGRGRGRKNTVPTKPDNKKPESKAVSTPSKTSASPKASPSPGTHSPPTVSPHAGHAALPHPKPMKRPSAATSGLKRPSANLEKMEEPKPDVWIQFHNMDKPLNVNNLTASQELMLERGVPHSYVPSPHEQEQLAKCEETDERPERPEPMSKTNKTQPKATVPLRKPASKSPKARGFCNLFSPWNSQLFLYLEPF